jgi:hypothetical protein
MSFKEPIPALSNVMDTNEHASPIRRRGARAGCGVGLYRPVTGALSSPDRAPSPTCPFIKINNVKEPTNRRGGQLIDPRFTPGDRLSVQSWRPMRLEPGKPRQRRVGEGHIWRRLSPVNGFFSKSSRRNIGAFQPDDRREKLRRRGAQELQPGPSFSSLSKTKPAAKPASSPGPFRKAFAVPQGPIGNS